MGDKSLSPLDPSSHSRPELAIVTHISLVLSIKFETKTLAGHVDLRVCKKDKNAKAIILDSLDLDIEDIIDLSSYQKLTFKVDKPLLAFGSKLEIDLPASESNEFTIRITYSTKPSATGIQWLSPDQTAGKTHPYMFSQFEPIACRSVIPLQDSPGVKTKYNATITAPSDFTVLMSAVSTGTRVLDNGTTEYDFEQNVPIPSYLFAIACGVIESRIISPRSMVWAEKEIVDAAKFEFADTEKQLSTAERICGPYVWGRYDLLILPPSFPFGGMENPCLTFVTPTLLAGDRSLANVIAHEIAHSWSGNLVTNSNFEHFWLNEGFTVFIERRIISKMEGELAQDFQALAGLEDLKEGITKELGENNSLTALVPNLKNLVHPDDSFSRVPYEKGSLFLRYLEALVGGPERFEPFLKKYFDVYKYQSIDSNEFKKFFTEYFTNCTEIQDIDWDNWLYKPGMPIAIPKYNNSQELICHEIKKKIDKDFSNFSKDDLKPLSSQQVIHLLQLLLDGEPLPMEKLEKLGEVLNIKNTKNSEILFRWYRLCIKARREDVVQDILNWITEVGRMKFVRPLYRDLFKFDKARHKAVENFRRSRSTMMHVTAYTVAGDLQLRDD